MVRALLTLTLNLLKRIADMTDRTACALALVLSAMPLLLVGCSSGANNGGTGGSGGGTGGAMNYDGSGTGGAKQDVGAPDTVGVALDTAPVGSDVALPIDTASTAGILDASVGLDVSTRIDTANDSTSDQIVDAPTTVFDGGATVADGSLGSEAGGTSTEVGAGIAGTATLFIPDDLDNVIYRYNITLDADPVLTATIPNNLAYAPAVRSTGELFVANYLQAGTVSRFLSPLGNPIANGTIANVGIIYPDTMLFVDDELWVPNTAPDCSTGAASLVRLGFDSQGNASAVGTVTSGLIGANRGMAWGPTTRDLFISQCNTPYTIQHYRVASDHSVTMLTPITGNGIYNPAGMVVAPWGELLVSNEGTASSAVHGSSILRFLIDAQGNVTPNGAITGNGMDSPWGLAFTPWGELIACNNAAGTLSRFTFNAAHAATPNGTFQLVAHHVLLVSGTAAIAIVPGASTMIQTDGGG